MKAPILAILFTVMAFAVSAQSQALNKLLPPPVSIKGWALAREAEVYSGDQLFDLIDGGADLFFEYRFNAVVSAVYAGPSGNKIQVEVYDMSNDSAAYGIFSSIYGASETGRELGEYAVVKEQYVAFLKGHYYVNVAWILTSEPMPGALMNFASAVESQIAISGHLPALLSDLQTVPHRGIPVYFMGNIALSNVYYFDYKDQFAVEQGLAFRDGDVLKIVFQYSNKETSTAVFSNAHDFIEGSKRFHDRGMIYQGFTCYDNKGNRIVFRLGDGFIAVVVALKADVELMPVLDEFVNSIELSL